MSRQFLMVAVAAVVAFSPIGSSFAQDAVPTRSVSPGDNEDFRAKASSLIQIGLPEEALQLLRANLAANRDDTETNFLLGLALLESDRPEEAIPYFQGILAKNPDLPRVRAELARALAANQQYDLAKTEFVALKASALPSAVGENIDRFLAAMEARKFWQVRVGAGMMYDTNANFGPSSSATALIGGTSVPLGITTHSDWAAVFSAGVSNIFPINRRLSWQSEVSLYDTEYSQQRDFTSRSLALSTGPNWRLNRATAASLPLIYEKTSLGSEPYNEAIGFAPQVQYSLSSTGIVSAGLNWTERAYKNTATSTTRKDRDSVARGANAAYRRILSDTSYFQIGARYIREDAAREYFTYEGYNLNAQFYTALPKGLSLTVAPQVTYNRYQAAETVLSLEPRTDTIYSLVVNLAKPIGEHYVFTTGLNYTIADSNVALYDYRRTQISFQIARQF